MAPRIQPRIKAATSKSIVSTYSSFDIKFSFNIVLNKTVLDHGDQITSTILWHNEPYWTLTPTTLLKELCVETAMFFLGRIKSHQRPAIVF
jgi:hypothetical protein